ncbi:unnamed protein product [Adineta ricciae]|uniref:Uncharacterized protein n=1 Tax=Adineta ricciae TaxID=249248 RepID=A0A816G381_ADIRI|nr:unnamed protein product [Adineta ricciae]
MGNVAYKVKHPHELLHSSSAPKHGPSDYGAHSRSSFTTTDAPWNVTQWIDPLDPHPKLNTMPILIVIRK